MEWICVYVLDSTPYDASVHLLLGWQKKGWPIPPFWLPVPQTGEKIGRRGKRDIAHILFPLLRSERSVLCSVRELAFFSCTLTRMSLKQTNKPINQPQTKTEPAPPQRAPPHLPKAGLFLFSLCMKVVSLLIMQLNKVYLLSVSFIKYLFLSGNPEF